MNVDDVKIRKSTRSKPEITSDDENDGEQIIWEKDVFVCNEMPNSELYCITYPSSKMNAWEEGKNKSARFKKNVRMLEMRMVPDMHTGSYDRKKADELSEAPSSSASDMNTFKKLDEVYEGRAFMNEHPLINSIGFVRDDAFYLSPLNGTFEMHRSLNAINKKKNKNEDEDGMSNDEEETPAATNIRVKFSRPETERQKKKREASALHREKRIASDVWIPMGVHLEKHAESQRKLELMAREDGTSADDAEKIDMRELVSKAIICSIKEELVIESGKEHMLTKQRINELPIHLKIKAHLIKSHVMRTSEIRRLVEDVDDAQLFSLLQECARLVNGVWVLHSELMFNNLPPAHSNVAGRTDVYRSELWRNARDLALALIDAGQRVTRMTLITCFRLNEKDAEEVLSTFGYCDKEERRWKLRIERDEDFLNDASMQKLIISEKRKWVERFDELLKIVENMEKTD